MWLSSTPGFRLDRISWKASQQLRVSHARHSRRSRSFWAHAGHTFSCSHLLIMALDPGLPCIRTLLNCRIVANTRCAWLGHISCNAKCACWYFYPTHIRFYHTCRPSIWKAQALHLLQFMPAPVPQPVYQEILLNYDDVSECFLHMLHIHF